MLHGILYMIASVTVALAVFMLFVAPLVLALSVIGCVIRWLFPSPRAKRPSIGL